MSSPLWVWTAAGMAVLVAATTLASPTMGRAEGTEPDPDASIAPTVFMAPTQAATLVQTIDTSAFVPTSPDPSGVAWIEGSDRLLVTDSEVNQYPYFADVNMWQVRRDGVVTGTGTTTAWSKEPTGLTVDEAGARYFTSDDNNDTIYEIGMGADGLAGSGDDVLQNEFVTASYGSTDPEGLTFDKRRGWLHIVDGDGDAVYTIDPGPNSTFEGGGDDVISTFATDGAGIISPEGITHSEFTDRLAVVDYQRAVVAEFSVTGEHLRDIDISAAATVHPGGATWGKSSDGSGTSLWIVDRGLDVAIPSDGQLFEFRVPASPIVRVTPDPARFAPVGPDSRHLVVSNVGTDVLFVNTMKVTGDPTFSLVTAPAPVVLAPNESIDVEVRFDGAATGAHVGHLEVVSTSSEVGTYSVPLLSLTCPVEAAPFTDVAPTSFALNDIACIYGLGVTTGTSPTTYSPAAVVTRQQMAAFLARIWRALGNDCPSGATPFTDVAPTSFALNDIACIYGLGVTTGTSPTTYSPARAVTREQMAAFLARLFRAYADP